MTVFGLLICASAQKHCLSFPAIKRDELGVKGHWGILTWLLNMASCAAFLQDSSHRIRWVYTPKH